MYSGVKCSENTLTPPPRALDEFQTHFSCGTICLSSPGIWSLVKWVSATSFQLFFCSPRICFLSTSQRHWIVSSPGTSAFYITSTAQKTLLFVQFSLAASLVSISSLLDDGATICLYIIPPSVLCVTFSYLAEEDLQVRATRCSVEFLICSILANTHIQLLSLQNWKSLNCPGADVVWRLLVLADSPLNSPSSTLSLFHFFLVYFLRINLWITKLGNYCYMTESNSCMILKICLYDIKDLLCLTRWFPAVLSMWFRALSYPATPFIIAFGPRKLLNEAHVCVSALQGKSGPVLHWGVSCRLAELRDLGPPVEAISSDLVQANRADIFFTNSKWKVMFFFYWRTICL